jgi:hypothetical protein
LVLMYCARSVSEFLLLSLYGALSRLSSDAAKFGAKKCFSEKSTEATLIEPHFLKLTKNIFFVYFWMKASANLTYYSGWVKISIVISFFT